MTAANLLFPAETAPVVPVAGETRGYPVHRIFCVGRNYADHAKEMGFEVDREAPWYFTKADNANGQVLVVSRVSEKDTCHVAYIDARANDDAIVMARRIADEYARGFDCSHSPSAEGETGKSPM